MSDEKQDPVEEQELEATTEETANLDVQDAQEVEATPAPEMEEKETIAETPPEEEGTMKATPESKEEGPKYVLNTEKLNAYLASAKPQDQIAQITRGGNFISMKDRNTIYIPLTLLKA